MINYKRNKTQYRSSELL